MPEKKLLIVEDDVSLLETLKNRLSREFVVQIAYDGTEGLAAAVAHRPDAILLDIAMPRLNGTAVLQELRESGGIWGAQVPVILLTNIDANPDILATVTPYNPAEYIVKADNSLEDIVAKVRATLGLNTPAPAIPTSPT